MLEIAERSEKRRYRIVNFRSPEMLKSVRHASKTDKICSCLTKVTQILVRMTDGEVLGTQQSLTMKCPLVT